MKRTKPTGYIRERAGKLEAVIKLEGRKATRATGLSVGQEAAAQQFLADLLGELGEALEAPAKTSSAPGPAADGDMTLQAWGERWITERKERGVVSAPDEEAHLRLHAYPKLGAVPVRELTKAQMITWVRTLQGRVGVESGKPLSARYIHHIAATVRRLLGEAVDMDLITVNPCAWKSKRDLPSKVDQNERKRRSGGFKGWEVWQLLHDERVPEERRVLYALEFLTGMRTGEVSARRWKDLDTTVEPLGRLEVKTAWNSRAHLEKRTKTLVEKVVPVHPLLAGILASWWSEGWARYAGRKPGPEDLLVPSDRGRRRGASHSNRQFQDDVRKLGLEKLDGGGQAVRRTHYETRATFRSLALAGGAVREDLDLITHPSPRQASDLYTRLDEVWPLLCSAVKCVRIEPREGPVAARPGRSQEGSQTTGEMPVSSEPPKRKAPRRETLEPSMGVAEMARGTGVEPVAFSSGG